MEQIKKLLESREIRPSHHRILILKYLSQTHNHPTVDEVFRDLAPQAPTITKATIYNSLKVFLEKNLVSSFSTSGGETRYDYKCSAHAHFHCMNCDRVIDVLSKYPCYEVKNVGHNKVQEVQLFFKGLCKKCLKKSRAG
jgi:Fe2+ or Zn2+ uptake regulation protein